MKELKYAFFARLSTVLICLSIIFYSNLTLVANAQSTTQLTTNKTEISFDSEQLEKCFTIIDSETSSPWNDFLKLLLSATLGSFGTFLIFERIRRISTRKEKNKLSYELAKEWDSYREHRNKADQLFVKKPKHQTFSDYDENERVNMNVIVEFFDRVDLAKKYDMINVPALYDYLSTDYSEWEELYFEEQRKLLENDPIYSYLFKGPYTWLYTDEKKKKKG